MPLEIRPEYARERAGDALVKITKYISNRYNSLPFSIRNIITPALKPSYFAAKRFRSILSQLQLPVYQIKGKNKWGGGVLTVLVFGEGRGILPYLLAHLYDEKPTKKKIGKIFLGKLQSSIESEGNGADMVLVGIDQFFARYLSRKGFMVFPEWLMFKLDPAKPLPTGRKNKALHENLKKVRKFGYTYEITRELSQFKHFYHHMYLPYAGNKHGDLSLVGDFTYLKKIFEKGALLLVNRGNESLAGFLIEMDVDSISARYSGVRDGNIEYVAEGALSACYYYTISWAKEKGYKWIDFGHCRPFLNDGPFMHKKKWGMEIMKSSRLMFETKSAFGMKICNYQNGLLEYLARNPFIALDRGKLKAMVFVRQDHPLTIEEIQAQW